MRVFANRYSDGDLTLIYFGGDECSSGFQRMSVINFECNETAGGRPPLPPPPPGRVCPRWVLRALEFLGVECLVSPARPQPQPATRILSLPPCLLWDGGSALGSTLTSRCGSPKVDLLTDPSSCAN